MSQFAHPAVTTRVPRSTRTTLIAALLALGGVSANALVIALGNHNYKKHKVAVARQAHPNQRADSGPEESAVAASIGTFAIAQPDESHIAALVAAGTTQPTTGGPDESTTAASVAGSSGPDESTTAAAISGH